MNNATRLAISCKDDRQCDFCVSFRYAWRLVLLGVFFRLLQHLCGSLAEISFTGAAQSRFLMRLCEVNNNQTELHWYPVLNLYICFLEAALEDGGVNVSGWQALHQITQLNRPHECEPSRLIFDNRFNWISFQWAISTPSSHRRTTNLCRREPSRSSCRRSGRPGARSPPTESSPAGRRRPGCSRRLAGPSPPRRRWLGSGAACRSELEMEQRAKPVGTHSHS